MTTITSFVNRLKKIGIEVSFVGNYPWVYLHTINDKKVKGTYLANHGFTVFFMSSKPGESCKITDITTIFNKIRETLNEQETDKRKIQE